MACEAIIFASVIVIQTGIPTFEGNERPEQNAYFAFASCLKRVQSGDNRDRDPHYSGFNQQVLYAHYQSQRPKTSPRISASCTDSRPEYICVIVYIGP